MKVKVVKWCRKKWNEHNLMYIYHKQCEIKQKIQWNSSNGQLQPFMLIIASLMDASTFIFYQITEWTPNVCIFRVSRRFAEYLHCKQWNILPVFSCCSLLCFFNLSLCLNVLSQLEQGSFSVTLWVFFCAKCQWSFCKVSLITKFAFKLSLRVK